MLATKSSKTSYLSQPFPMIEMSYRVLAPFVAIIGVRLL